jgi:hypothetical protein
MDMRRQPNRLLGAARGLLVVGLLLLASCGGYPSGLVIVRVSGLVSSITELLVTLQLDGVPAKNSRAPAGAADPGSFLIHDDMQRFGVQVPPETTSLTITIVGHNTALETVRTGSATLDLSQGSEVEVPLR